MTNFYVLFDKKLEEFNYPVAFGDEKKALVAIEREVKSGNGVIAQCPSDFVLYKAFSFDQSTGEIIPDLVIVQDLALLPWSHVKEV